MTKINSIAWNVSNIFGLYASLYQIPDLDTYSSLTLILGPKCNAKNNDIKIYHQVFKKLKFKQVTIYELPNYLRFLYCIFPALFAKIDFQSTVFLLPTPANPPVTFLTPWISIYFYGDGLGSKPIVSYQWQPSFSNSSLISKIRFYAMKLNFNIINKFQIPTDISASNLNSNTYINSLIQCFSICYSHKISTFIRQSKISAAKKLHIFVLSVISPVRANFSDEIRLYTDFIMRHIGRADSNELLIIKFHHHHDKRFRQSFIEALESKTSSLYRIIEFVPTIPSESLLVAFNQLLPSTNIHVYTFQQSFILMSAIKNSLNTALLRLSFGFDDDLVLKYFYHDEISKRLDYQRAMLLKTKDSSK